jgi:hypothetical protein
MVAHVCNARITGPSVKAILMWPVPGYMIPNHLTVLKPVGQGQSQLVFPVYDEDIAVY